MSNEQNTLEKTSAKASKASDPVSPVGEPSNKVGSNSSTASSVSSSAKSPSGRTVKKAVKKFSKQSINNITKSISQFDIKKKWFLVDAQGITLGKLASKVAHILMGKHKTSYTKHMDDGDNVVVINAQGVKLTGKKLEQKKYYYHTNYVGHLRERGYDYLMEKKPDFVVEKAIKGMLPKNKLGSKQFSNLYVYANATHRHAAQKPTSIKID